MLVVEGSYLVDEFRSLWGLTGAYCLVCEGELRAIARYGSTAGMSDATIDGQTSMV